MVFSSLGALALQWQTIARSFSGLRRGRNRRAPSDLDQRMAAIEVPLGWLVAGLVPITLGLLAIQYFAFHISIGWD